MQTHVKVQRAVALFSCSQNFRPQKLIVQAFSQRGENGLRNTFYSSLQAIQR